MDRYRDDRPMAPRGRSPYRGRSRSPPRAPYEDYRSGPPPRRYEGGYAPREARPPSPKGAYPTRYDDRVPRERSPPVKRAREISPARAPPRDYPRARSPGRGGYYGRPDDRGDPYARSYQERPVAPAIEPETSRLSSPRHPVRPEAYADAGRAPYYRSPHPRSPRRDAPSEYRDSNYGADHGYSAEYRDRAPADGPSARDGPPAGPRGGYRGRGGPRDGPPRDGPPREYPPRDYPPREYTPREYPPRDFPPRDHPPREYTPRDYPPRDHGQPSRGSYSRGGYGQFGRGGAGNGTSMTTPRTQRFNNAVQDLPKVKEGGEKLPNVHDSTKADKLEEEAARLRKIIDEKQAKKRQGQREWDRLERETRSSTMRTEMAEEQLRAHGEDMVISAAAF